MAKKAKAKSKVKSKSAVASNAMSDRIEYLLTTMDTGNIAAGVRSEGGAEFPFGKSQSALVEKAIAKFNKSGDVMFSIILVGTDDEVGDSNKSNVGTKHAINHTIWTKDNSTGRLLSKEKFEERVKWVIADFEAMGIDWTVSFASWMKDLNEAPEGSEVHIEEIEGLNILVTVRRGWDSKTKKETEHVNYLIVGLAESGSAEDGGDEEYVAPPTEDVGPTEDEIRAGCTAESPDMEALAEENDIDTSMSWEDMADALVEKLC